MAPPGGVWRSGSATWVTRLTEALLAPLPALGPAWRLGVRHLLRLAPLGILSPGAFARRFFQSEAARRVVPGLSLHADLGPDDFAGAGMGLVLALMAASSGFRVPRGGARAITQALLRRLEEAGGKLRLGARVARILVRQRRAVGVQTEQGEEIAVRRAVIADVGPPALFLQNAWRTRDNMVVADADTAFSLCLGHVQDGLGLVRSRALVVR